MTTRHRLCAIGLAALVGLTAAGCGGVGATKTVTVTETVAGAQPTSSVTTAAATKAATTTSSGSKGGTVKLLGAPVLLHSSGRYYVAAVRLVNTAGEPKNVSVQFDGMRGSKVLDSDTDVRTILPGQGAAQTQLELPKGTRAIRASISVDDAFVLDPGLTTTTLVGKARFARGQYGDCTMSVQVRNGGAKKLVLVGVWFVALHRGKIVSAGFTFPEVNPHLTGLAKAGLVPCAAKVDTVRAFVEG